MFRSRTVPGRSRLGLEEGHFAEAASEAVNSATAGAQDHSNRVTSPQAPGLLLVLKTV